MRHILTALCITLIILFAASISWSGSLTVPYTFSSGTTALASEVNANFDAVETEVTDNADEIADKQDRVTGTCPTGYSIRIIASDGSVTCEEDDVGSGGGGGDITAVNTNAPLTGGSTSGDVTLGIATGGITATHLATGSVDYLEIATGAVGVSEIAPGAVTFSHIADNVLPRVATNIDTSTDWNTVTGGTTRICNNISGFNTYSGRLVINGSLHVINDGVSPVCFQIEMWIDSMAQRAVALECLDSVGNGAEGMIAYTYAVDVSSGSHNIRTLINPIEPGVDYRYNHDNLAVLWFPSSSIGLSVTGLEAEDDYILPSDIEGGIGGEIEYP